MSKSKHAKPDEFQKEQIRHLKKLIKQKDQTIRTLEKELGYSQNKTEKEFRKPKEEILCPECGKSELHLLEIIGRLFEICPLCKFRKKI